MTDQPITSQPVVPSNQTVPPSINQDDALSVLEQAIAAASAQNDQVRAAADQASQSAQTNSSISPANTDHIAAALSQTTPPPAAIDDPTQTSTSINQPERDTLDGGELAQALPQAVLSATDTLNPTTSTRTTKESLGAVTPDNTAQAEAGGGVQAVEQEKNPELSPEVEGFINKVENNADQLPKEIVIADAIKNLPQNHPLPKQAVIILPITPDVEEEGAKKSPKFSVRWLVEWSRKVMKMFVGKVIYRSE